MKVAAGVATALVLVCAAGLTAGVASGSSGAVSTTVVVVTTAADVVNGDVSSVAALNANPGTDGISLREALMAADATGGSATTYIMFSAALNGQTIEVVSKLPPLHRDHLVLEGVTPDGSPARVTLDGSLAQPATMGELLLVQASEVTVRWLRFTGVDPTQNPQGRQAAVIVRQGANGALPVSPGPPQIANVQIVDDVFDNTWSEPAPQDTDRAAVGRAARRARRKHRPHHGHHRAHDRTEHVHELQR